LGDNTCTDAPPTVLAGGRPLEAKRGRTSATATSAGTCTPTLVEEERRTACQRCLLARRSSSDERGSHPRIKISSHAHTKSRRPPQDPKERRYWKGYQKAFEEALSSTSTEQAPWYVVPANHKWYRNLVVAELLVHALEDMDPRPPKIRGMDWKKLRREVSEA